MLSIIEMFGLKTISSQRRYVFFLCGLRLSTLTLATNFSLNYTFLCNSSYCKSLSFLEQLVNVRLSMT